MDRQQFLLTKLAEECSEVAQIALKTQQFGLDEVRRDQPLTNRERVHQELNDLLAIVEMLNDEFDLEFIPSVEEVAAKKLKVNKYFKYSVGLGLVSS